MAAGFLPRQETWPTARAPRRPNRARRPRAPGSRPQCRPRARSRTAPPAARPRRGARRGCAPRAKQRPPQGRGPKAPRGTSAGSSARALCPQSGQPRRLSRCSVTLTEIPGSSQTLVAGRHADGLALRLPKAVPAAATIGPVVDQLVDRLDRRQPAAATPTARQGPLRSPRRVGPLALGRPGRVLAGRRRGVTRVALEPALELGDPLVLAGHPLGQPLHLLGQTPVLGGDLDEHPHHDLAAPVVDRPRLAALHAHRIRRGAPHPRSCQPPRPTERLPKPSD